MNQNDFDSIVLHFGTAAAIFDNSTFVFCSLDADVCLQLYIQGHVKLVTFRKLQIIALNDFCKLKFPIWRWTGAVEVRKFPLFVISTLDGVF